MLTSCFQTCSAAQEVFADTRPVVVRNSQLSRSNMTDATGIERHQDVLIAYGTLLIIRRPRARVSHARIKTLTALLLGPRPARPTHTTPSYSRRVRRSYRGLDLYVISTPHMFVVLCIVPASLSAFACVQHGRQSCVRRAEGRRWGSRRADAVTEDAVG